MAHRRKSTATYNMAGCSDKNSDISKYKEKSSDTPVLQYYRVLSDDPVAHLVDDSDEINAATRIFFNIKGSTSSLFDKVKSPEDMLTPPAPPPTPSSSDTCGKEDAQSECTTDDEEGAVGPVPIPMTIPIPTKDLLKHLPRRETLKEKASAFTGIITKQKSKIFKDNLHFSITNKMKDSTSSPEDKLTPPAPPSTSSCGNEDALSGYSADDEEEAVEPVSISIPIPLPTKDLLKHLPPRETLKEKAPIFIGMITRQRAKILKEQEKLYKSMNKIRMTREDFLE